MWIHPAVIRNSHCSSSKINPNHTLKYHTKASINTWHWLFVRCTGIPTTGNTVPTPVAGPCNTADVGYTQTTLTKTVVTIPHISRGLCSHRCKKTVSYGIEYIALHRVVLCTQPSCNPYWMTGLKTQTNNCITTVQLYCPNGIFSHGKFGLLFPGESQLSQPPVHAGCFSVSIIHRTLTWTTGSLTCT